MQDSFDITTLIFIVLAIFVVWRLRSVLGQKTGSEQPPLDPISRRDPPLRPNTASADQDNVVRLPGANGARPTIDADRHRGRTMEGLRGTGHGDGPRRSTKSLARSRVSMPRASSKARRSAYEMIVSAFAQGDRKTLKDLLSREVYEGFERAITEREQRGEKVETTFVSVDKAEITGAEVQSKTAQLSLRFLSKLITVTRDAADARRRRQSRIRSVDVTDVWTFERALGSRDPNWKLVATEAGQ